MKPVKMLRCFTNSATEFLSIGICAKRNFQHMLIDSRRVLRQNVSNVKAPTSAARKSILTREDLNSAQILLPEVARDSSSLEICQSALRERGFRNEQIVCRIILDKHVIPIRSLINHLICDVLCGVPQSFAGSHFPDHIRVCRKMRQSLSARRAAQRPLVPGRSSAHESGFPRKSWRGMIRELDRR